MTVHYAKTEQGGIRFVSERRPGEVRIPNYVYDLWMPIVGVDAIGVYAVYCRLEREGTVKAINQQRLTREMRIGVDKLNRINKLLEKHEFIKVRQPKGHEKLMHWTMEVTVKDPPIEVPAETIEKCAHPKGYEVLSTWLCEGHEKNSHAENPKQSCAEGGNSHANVAPSFAPSVVAEEPALPDSPFGPLDDALAGVDPATDDVAETEAMFDKTKPSEPRTAEQHKAGIQRALEKFDRTGGNAGVADPSQDDGWLRTAKEFSALIITPNVPESTLRLWVGDIQAIVQDSETGKGPEEVCTAIRSIATCEDYEWLRSCNRPTHKGFVNALLAVLWGQELPQRERKAGGPSTPREQPISADTVVVG